MIDYTENVDTIAQFGPEFQTKVIAAMMEDSRFLGQVMDVLNPNYFESDAAKWIVNKSVEFYQEYRNSPTLEYFRAEFEELKNKNELKTGVLDQLKRATENVTAKDLEYVEDKFLDFAKNQTLKIAILKSADLLQAGRYSEIKTMVDQAMKAGTQKDVGLIWDQDIDIRHIYAARDVLSTGWSGLDVHFDGGLGPGELGVIAAPSGAGKSWILTALGKAALMQGKTVVHYSYELNQNYQGIRYDTAFTGIEPKKLSDHLDFVKEKIAEVPGHLLIKYFPSRTVNTHTLMAHLDYLKAYDVTPDVIIIDYADLMRATVKSEARYQELGYIYEEIRGMAGELQVPIWTASQTQRSSINEDVIEADKIAESYDKVKTADVLLSLSRKVEDKINNTGRIHIVKNRFGPDGITLPARIDTARGIVEVHDSNSSEGAALQSEMEEGQDKMNDFLLQKLNKFNQSKMAG
ncbi:MAG: DnaB-like helicase C-terminal domain-containing protein [Betaproteobacteria bacterium]|jgi:replicative DNA helicase